MRPDHTPVRPTNPFIKFRKDEIEQSIPDRFEQKVAKYHERVAVKTRNHQFTYDALNKMANRVARAILVQRGKKEEPIALLLGHDATMITSILGVLKSGKTCVPLEPACPPARSRYILEDSETQLIVTNNTYLSLANELVNNTLYLINIDELESGLTDENIGLSIPPETLAYILYTSGSTGQPKGVTQTHCNLLHSVMGYINSFHIHADDRLTLLASCSGGQGMKTTFSALLTGASLYPWNIQEEGLANLASWIITEGITVYISSVTVFRSFVTTLREEEQFPKLRLVTLGTEPVHQGDFELYKRHFSPDCILVNWFASTEAGNIACYFIDKKTEITGEIVPAGYVCEDTQILLLDDNGQQIGFNQIGEIAIKSRYLSPGYWRRPDFTLAKFLPDPNGGDERIYLSGDLGVMLPGGCLYHVGRKDFQVKVRGNRIEVGEIETALVALDEIREAVVVAEEDRTGDNRLVAYIVPVEKPAPSVGTLRRALAEKLPDYMVPSAFVLLDALPLTPNGKVDRRALLEPDQRRPELEETYVAPRTPVEEVLSEIWSKVLGVEQVGVCDNFFALGGHSLLAAMIISRVRETFHVELPLRILFEQPTVEELATAITKTQAERLDQAELSRMLAELESLSDDEPPRSLTNDNK